MRRNSASGSSVFYFYLFISLFLLLIILFVRVVFFLFLYFSLFSFCFLIYLFVFVLLELTLYYRNIWLFVLEEKMPFVISGSLLMLSCSYFNYALFILFIFLFVCSRHGFGSLRSPWFPRVFVRLEKCTSTFKHSENDIDIMQINFYFFEHVFV